MKAILPKLYAEELFRFYIHDQEVLNKVIFDKYNLDPYTRDNLINDVQFGWGKPQTFVEWIKLVHLPAEMRPLHPNYEIMRDKMGLSEQAMKGLTNDKSTIHRLSEALNGTIKCRAWAKNIEYT